MVKVENKDTLRFVTKKFMKQNHSRNIIAVIAIMLTCLLFTSLFMGSVSLVLSKRASDIKQYMDSSHAVGSNYTKEESIKIGDALKKDSDVERYGAGIFLGSGIDPRFGYSTEVRCGDDNFAESYNCTPTTGKLPVAEDEIAVSTIVLDTLKVPHKLGEKVIITYEQNGVNGEQRTKEFRLSGFWEGDPAVMAQILWVSKSYAEINQHDATRKDLDNGLYNGGLAYVVWYHNIWNLREKTEQLSERAGITEIEQAFQVNPAYDLMQEDSFPILSLCIMILFIVLAGYLIIYNIFNISVKTDIRTYGLLKNIGTTGKQLKKIVRMQAWRLSIVGIPFGLLFGYGATLLMAPSLNTNMEMNALKGSGQETVVSVNPLIFVVAAVFTLITVYLSSLRACKLVENISPIEALRLAESNQSKRKMKKSTSVAWYAMAIQNMLRNWKKGLIVMLSIALSMVVVNCVVMLVNGYDFKSYTKVFLSSDFQLDQMTSTLTNTNFNGVTPEVREKLDNAPYTEESGYVYYSDESHEMEPHLKEIWDNFKAKQESNWHDYERAYWDEMQTSGKLSVHFLGISEFAFEKISWRGESGTWEDFKAGDKVIVDYNDQNSENPVSYYAPGDTFHMNYKSGKKKDYQVLGEGIMPYSLDFPYSDMFYITIMVPDTEYMEYVGNDCAMYAAVDAKKGMDRKMDKYIQKEILNKDERMNVFSMLQMHASFEQYVRKYYMIGGCLALVLALIGIMNFFNTTATSVLNRKREFALLEAVGMTKKQISKMLVMEGFIYLGGAFLLAVLILCTCAEQLLTNTLGMAFFFRMHLTIVPCICMLPLMAVVAYVIPRKLFRKMGKESIIMRIRVE
ncbi:MAG: ABC transporter permease [Lachnospiraceae bacterium]